MLITPDGARMGKILVYPSNWKSKSASISVPWYIKYRLYYPGSKPKQIVIKGMNRFSLLRDRQEETKRLLKEIWTDVQLPPADKKNGGSLFELLILAATNIQVTDRTRADLFTCIRGLKKWNEDTLILSRSVLKQMLENCYSNPNFTDKTYNHYRKYLSLLFSYLLEIEKVDVNYAKDLKSKQIVHLHRKILTDEEFTTISHHLYSADYEFWRFMYIFMYSGARISELLLVKSRDVDLTGQIFSITIIKGKYRRQCYKPIADCVLHLWKELKPQSNKYLFNYSNDNVVKKWHKLVKSQLSIEADFYSLKHYFLTKVAQKLGMSVAADIAGHTSIKTTSKYYVQSDNFKLLQSFRL